jgi:hypothetical protein
MSTRLEHVLRVGAQHAAHRTAPTAAFGDTERVPREAMDRALQLLDQSERLQHMQRELQELQSLSDAELYQSLRTLPRELLMKMQDRIDDNTYLPQSDSTVAVSNLLVRLYEGRYDERGRGASLQTGGEEQFRNLLSNLMVASGRPDYTAFVEGFSQLNPRNRARAIAIFEREVDRLNAEGSTEESAVIELAMDLAEASAAAMDAEIARADRSAERAAVERAYELAMEGFDLSGFLEYLREEEAARAAVQEAYDDLGPDALQNL